MRVDAQIDLCKVERKADSFEFEAVGGRLEHLKLDPLVGSAVMLDAHLVLINEDDVPHSGNRLVENTIPDNGSLTMVCSKSMKLFAFAILAVLIHSFAHAQDMSNLKGLRLGALISEIRKAPYPDAARWPDVKLICTGDKERSQISSRGSAPNENLLKFGVVVCGYYRPSGRNYFYWGLDFFGVTRMHVLFFFTPATFPAELRSQLYMISLESPTEHFDAITASLTNTYGAPSYSKPEKFQSQGKTYDNLRLGWRSSGGILVAERYFHDTKTMYVTYQHERLSDAVDSAERKLSK